MLSRVPIRAFKGPSRLLSTRTYSSASRLTLAYDLHEAPKGANPKNAPIIFMHGLFGSKKNNRSISKALARDLGRSIYAVDLRNHGDSPHNPRHDYLAMADDIAGFIEEHNLRDPTLIGHSMGAKTAMTLALHSPSLIKDVVSVDNAPIDVSLQSSFSTYIKGMQKIDVSGVTSLRAADAILAPYEPSIAVRQFLLSNLHNPPGQQIKSFKVPLDVLEKSIGYLGDFPYKNPEETRFEKRVLFVRGTQSHYVPDEALPVIGRFFPRFEVVDVDCGHWVISEKPEEFRRAVVEFLKPQE